VYSAVRFCPSITNCQAYSILTPILIRSLIYFSLVFLSGFILGIFRILFLVPEIGERYAELVELPLMLIVIYFSAKYVVHQLSALPRPTSYLTVGVIALGLLLLTEFTIVLGLRGISLAEYFSSRDPFSGSAYALSLILYSLMPYITAKKQSAKKNA
jgi:hypothetical protein